VVTYLATHGPMATECRMAFCASKISPALEGIADQAVNIARRARHLNALAEVNPGVDILPMGRIVLGMIREAISSFVEVDPAKAAPIVLLDKQVDDLNRENERLLHRVMAEQTGNIPAFIHLMFISRALEKSGDFAKQIAEDVHYLYTAQDIRHEKNR
jgi:phosphate transport system protein